MNEQLGAGDAENGRFSHPRPAFLLTFRHFLWRGRKFEPELIGRKKREAR